MEIYLGKKGLKASWQEPFKKEVKCVHCGGNSRIAFVAREGNEGIGGYICNLYNNTGSKKNGKFWVHDAMACAVYLCEKCLEPTAKYNQA